MGKMTELLLGRQKDLDNHLANIIPPSGPDPAGAFDYLQKGYALSYMHKKTEKLISEAVKKLPIETIAQFFEEFLPEKERKELCKDAFVKQMRIATSRGTLSSLIRDGTLFGMPLNEAIAGMESVIGAERLAEEEALQAEDLPADAKAVLLMGMLSDIERWNFFQTKMTPEAQASYFKEGCRTLMDQSYFGSTLCDESGYGSPEIHRKAMEKLETLLPEPERAALEKQLENLVTPDKSPDRFVTPEKGKLDELEAEAAGDREKLALIEQARQILVYPSDEYLGYLDGEDTGNILPTPMKLVDGNANYTRERFLRDYQDVKKLSQRLPGVKAQYGDAPFYDPMSVQPREKTDGRTIGGELSQDEVEKLRTIPEPLPEPVSRAVLKIADLLEQIGVDRFVRPEVASKYTDEQGNVRYNFIAEQGNKKYAFWPLADTKDALRRAVQEKNWDEIGKQIREYKRIKPLYDEMLKAADSVSKLPLFPGNVNSTRVGNDLNPIPMEYLEDYTGHSRVNGVFCLFAVCHTHNIPVRQFLENPGTAMQELSRRVADQFTLSAHQGKSVGEQLSLALNMDEKTNACQAWNTLGLLLARAVDVPVGMCPDEKDRITQAGRAYGALAAANHDYAKRVMPWRVIAESGPDKRMALSQLTMLLPKDQVDFQKLGMKLMEDDWAKTVNPAAVAERLRREGKLDLSQITAHTQEILADVPKVGNYKGFCEIRRAALQNYRMLLRTTPDAETKSEGYQVMAAHAKQLQNEVIQDYIQDDVDSWEQNRTILNGFLSELEKEKSGFLLSSTNTKEHEYMTKALRLFSAKLDILAGRKPTNLTPEEEQRVRDADPAGLAHTAKLACIGYCRVKSNEGNGFIFHKAGHNRYRNAMNAADAIGQMCDMFDMRNPAIALKDNLTLDVLRHRNSKTWLKNNIVTVAAKAICALNLQYNGVNAEQQRVLLEDETLLEKQVERFKKDPAFKEMVRREGLSGLADQILGGVDGLTGAYFSAKQRLNDPKAAAIPERTPRQNVAMWKESAQPGEAAVPFQ